MRPRGPAEAALPAAARRGTSRARCAPRCPRRRSAGAAMGRRITCTVRYRRPGSRRRARALGWALLRGLRRALPRPRPPRLALVLVLRRTRGPGAGPAGGRRGRFGLASETKLIPADVLCSRPLSNCASD